MKRLLAAVLALTASGCPDIDVDQGEVGAEGPTAEFDPARSLATQARFIPFPTDLVRDPMTGKVNLSAQACESPAAKATRENVLNKLDGFGTYQLPIQFTFTEEVDEASLANKVVLLQVTNAGAPLDAATAIAVPVVVRKTTTLRFSMDNCAAPETVHAVVVVPAVPLSQKSTYVAVLKRGIRARSGRAFEQASTWGLVASATPPVTLDDQGNVIDDRTPLDPNDPADLAQLESLALLWGLHAPALQFLDASSAGTAARRDILVGTVFTTQTTTDPLDPSVATGPAGMLATTDFVVDPASITGRFGPFSALCGGEETTAPAQCFLKLALGGCSPTTTGCSAANYTAGTAACGSIAACAAVGDVLGGAISTTNYQTQLPNSLAAVPGVTPGMLQGAWSDPVAPEAQGALVLQTIATVPAGTAPAAGWPVVVFGHGLGSSKESVFAIAGRLSAAGFATVAIDFSAHGSRAVRTSTAVAQGCRGHCFEADGTDTGVECETAQPADPNGQCTAGQTCGRLGVPAAQAFLPPSPTSAAQCYAPIFTADLANTRDNIRQTVLDLERVVTALKACGTTNCGSLAVDPTRIFYGGISLGSLIGTTVASISPDIKAAALNVGGVGWLDVLENTQTLAIRCSLVNSLIDAGILMGDKWTGGSTGLCTTDAWKQQPGYAQFSAIARWVIDPADGANFAARLRAKPHLIQKAFGDTVVPNVSTDRQAAITGVAAVQESSSSFNPAAPFAESFVIKTNPKASKFVRYTTDANHTFVHSSLLRPAAQNLPGVSGTLRMQVDFAQFLDNNDDDSLP